MLPSGGTGARSYDRFRKLQLAEGMRPAFDGLREFCIALGDDVMEDVRPHRVVFCKSMNTRWFADAKPADDRADAIRIKISRGWRGPIQTVYMGRDGATQEIKRLIRAAYDKAH